MLSPVVSRRPTPSGTQNWIDPAFTVKDPVTFAAGRSSFALPAFTVMLIRDSWAAAPRPRRTSPALRVTLTVDADVPPRSTRPLPASIVRPKLPIEAGTETCHDSPFSVNGGIETL